MANCGAEPRSTNRTQGSIPQGQSWRIRPEFLFPFAGKRWQELYVNLNGNITFTSPETTQYPKRRTWSDGTMRSFRSKR